jgi:hypothetical protein
MNTVTFGALVSPIIDITLHEDEHGIGSAGVIIAHCRSRMSRTEEVTGGNNTLWFGPGMDGGHWLMECFKTQFGHLGRSYRFKIQSQDMLLLA